MARPPPSLKATDLTSRIRVVHAPADYYLSEGGAFEENQFDAHEFRVSRDKQQRVEGHLTKYQYSFDESKGAPASRLQIFRNYENAVTRIGGKVMYESDEFATIRISKDGVETWVEVTGYGNSYNLVIVERQAMQQDVVANPTALKSGLAQGGHVEVPGIYFDFGKSEVEPESDAALK